MKRLAIAIVMMMLPLVVGAQTITPGPQAVLRLLYWTGTSVGNAADTTENTLQSFTLPASTLLNAGDRVRIVAGGTMAASTDTKTARIKVGGQNLAAVAGTTAGGTSWRGEVELIKVSSNVQSVAAFSIVNNTGASIGSLGQTLTDTGTLAILITGQNSTNSVLGSITCRFVTVEYIPVTP
jgi:hypothetical protein